MGCGVLTGFRVLTLDTAAFPFLPMAAGIQCRLEPQEVVGRDGQAPLYLSQT